MNLLKRIIGAARTDVTAWMLAGSMIWTFLLTPYAIDAYDCKDGFTKGGSTQCLKPIAGKLRKDSIIATYATATVVAIIALQLSNRSRLSKPPSE